MRSLLLLSLVSLLSMSSCCTALGPAINAADKVDTADAPWLVQVVMYPVQVVTLFVAFPLIWGCMIEGEYLR